MFEHEIDILDFEAVWREPLSPYVRSRIASKSMTFHPLSLDQFNQEVRKVVQILLSDLKASGSSRANEWETGWSENFEAFRATGRMESLVPKYFGKIPIVRWRQEWINCANPALEYDMYGTLLDWVIDSRFDLQSEPIVELGCGTGHNLLRVHERWPKSKLVGLDWASSSQGILELLRSGESALDIEGYNFDYFNPVIPDVAREGATFFSVASLEQVGERYGDFLDELLACRPKRVIHIEPIVEMLDEENLVDFLSIAYCKKRNYLSGFLPHLRSREAAGAIRIVETKRTFVGSFFIDGYSLIVWEPV